MTSQEIFDAVLPLHQQLVELRDRAKGVAPTWQLSKSRTAWRGKSRRTTATSMLPNYSGTTRSATPDPAVTGALRLARCNALLLT